MSDHAMRILLVEDNPGDAVLLDCALRGVQHLEFQLFHVLTLREMAERLPAGEFDVLVLDMDLPDSLGLDTVRRAVAAAPHVPIVVLTGGNDENTGLETLRLGAQDYAMKGDLDGWALARTIRYAIERKQAQRALQDAHDNLERKVRERTAELADVVDVLQDEAQQRIAAQNALQRSNLALRMLTEANQAMVRTHDEQELVQTICRIAVERGGCLMAWVGFAEHDAQRTIRPVASAGFEDGYLESARFTWADEPLGRGPTGTAVRTGRVSAGSDFLSDPRLAPWKEAAVQRGFRSSIALPLSDGAGTFGALSVYSAEVDAFAGEIAEIMAQLANDMSYGIAALRSVTERRRLEKEVLQATEREQWRIGRDLHDSIQGSLTGIRMMLSVSEKRARQHSSQLGDEIHQVGEVVQQTLQQTRGLSHGLCPMDLHGLGLTRCLHELCGSMVSLFGIDCQFHHDEGLLIEDELTATQLYYIAQEAIHNAVKHSRGKRIAVSLSREDGGATLSVADDGRGIEAKPRPTGGLGMRSMDYRARLIGGVLEVRGASPHGTLVTCRVRLPSRW
jgi:signal transduction histidine kinase